MVLDIRHLWSQEKRPEPLEEIEVAENETAEPEEADHVIELSVGPEASGPAPQVDLDEVLTQAVEAGDAEARAAAVSHLRSLVPSPEGVELLCRIVETPEDARRLMAVQVLGHHRQWLASKTGLERLAGWARRERDPEVGAALVWALRSRDAISEFLRHPIEDMAREAALGLPVNGNTIEALVDALLDGRAADIDRILEEKLRGTRPGLVGLAVEVLTASAGEINTEQAADLLACLPQVSLFQLFVEGSGAPQWSLEQTHEGSERASLWHKLGRLAQQAMVRDPSVELIRHLVRHTARNDAFARRHAAFLQAAVARPEMKLSPDLLVDLERVTATASMDRLTPLVELLVELTERLEGRSARQAEALLEEWKSLSPELKLKIFHLQQGLK